MVLDEFLAEYAKDETVVGKDGICYTHQILMHAMSLIDISC